MYCPQVKSIDGAEHEIDCDLCMGSGYIDVRPIKTLSFLQSQLQENKQLPEGWIDGQSIAAKFHRGVELKYFTLVELIDFTDIYFQRINRSDGGIDRLKYNCKRVNVLIDSSGIEYFQGSDFQLTEDGDIKWSLNKRPTPDTIYSVHYEYPPRFRAMTAMHVNRYSQFKFEGEIQHIKFQEQWMLTREFLVLKRAKSGSGSGNELLDNPIPGYDEETPEDE